MVMVDQQHRLAASQPVECLKYGWMLFARWDGPNVELARSQEVDR